MFKSSPVYFVWWFFGHCHYLYSSDVTSSVLLKPNWDIQIPLVDGFGYWTMHSDFCYVASGNPSLPSSITYPYGRSFFQIRNFSIPIAHLDSSQKSSYTNYFHFFKILTGTHPKSRKTMEKEGKLNLPSILQVFCNFDYVPIGIWEKRR